MVADLGDACQHILPLCKPALGVLCDFPVCRRWNDFLNPLIYISSVKKYPLSLALRMALDDGYSQLEPDHGDVCAGHGAAGASVLPVPEILRQGVASTGLKGVMTWRRREMSFKVRALELHSQYAWDYNWILQKQWTL